MSLYHQSMSNSRNPKDHITYIQPLASAAGFSQAHKSKFGTLAHALTTLSSTATAIAVNPRYGVHILSKEGYKVNTVLNSESILTFYRNIGELL